MSAEISPYSFRFLTPRETLADLIEECSRTSRLSRQERKAAVGKVSSLADDAIHSMKMLDGNSNLEVLGSVLINFKGRKKVRTGIMAYRQMGKAARRAGW